MAYRIVMWIAVASLVGVALVSVASSVAGSYAGWTFYTPYSSSTQTLAMQVQELAMRAQTFLIPAAALSVAAYLLLLDREFRRRPRARGFDVEPARPVEEVSTSSSDEEARKRG